MQHFRLCSRLGALVIVMMGCAEGDALGARPDAGDELGRRGEASTTISSDPRVLRLAGDYVAYNSTEYFSQLSLTREVVWSATSQQWLRYRAVDMRTSAREEGLWWPTERGFTIQTLSHGTLRARSVTNTQCLLTASPVGAYREVGCNPEEVIATAQSEPDFVQSDGFAVYWVNRASGEGALMRTVPGEQPTQLMAIEDPRGLVMWGGRLYVANGARLESSTTTGEDRRLDAVAPAAIDRLVAANELFVAAAGTVYAVDRTTRALRPIVVASAAAASFQATGAAGSIAWLENDATSARLVVGSASGWRVVHSRAGAQFSALSVVGGTAYYALDRRSVLATELADGSTRALGTGPRWDVQAIGSHGAEGLWVHRGTARVEWLAPCGGANSEILYSRLVPVRAMTNAGRFIAAARPADGAIVRFPLGRRAPCQF